MQLARFQYEMSAAIDALRNNLAASSTNSERNDAIRITRLAIKGIQKKAKHVVDDRLIQQTSFHKMRGNRIRHGQENLLLIEEMTRSALAKIDDLVAEASE